MFDVQTYTKLHDAPCNFCGFFLQNLILAVLKRPKIGIWKEMARYTVQVLRKTARCIVQFCFLTRKAALILPEARVAALAVEAQPFRAKCMITIQKHV